MRFARARRLVALAALLVACAVAPTLACARVQARSRPDEVDSRARERVSSNVERRDYAGSAACARCHAAIAAAWARSPMHRMTREANGIEVRAPFDGTRWRFKEDSVVLDCRGDDRFCHVETSRGARNDYRVTMVLGGRTREDFVGVDVATGGDELVLPVSYVFKTGALRYKGYSVMVHERTGLRAGPRWKMLACFATTQSPKSIACWAHSADRNQVRTRVNKSTAGSQSSGARQPALSKMAPSRSQWPRKPPISGTVCGLSQDPPTRSRARRLQLSGRVSTGRRSWRWGSVARRAMGVPASTRSIPVCVRRCRLWRLGYVSTCRIRARPQRSIASVRAVIKSCSPAIRLRGRVAGAMRVRAAATSTRAKAAIFCSVGARVQWRAPLATIHTDPMMPSLSTLWRPLPAMRPAPVATPISPTAIACAPTLITTRRGQAGRVSPATCRARTWGSTDRSHATIGSAHPLTQPESSEIARSSVLCATVIAAWGDWWTRWKLGGRSDTPGRNLRSFMDRWMQT